jgi:hypothetical protein
MRLLSFLSDIERSICLEANAGEGAVWDSARIVNFKNGLARLTLTLREPGLGLPEGTILLQHFAMANGSFCLKASLSWQGSDAAPVVSVYDTPQLNWKLEASRIATIWIAGPAAALTTSSSQPEATMEVTEAVQTTSEPSVAESRATGRERVAVAVAG